MNFHPSFVVLPYLQIERANCFEGQRCLDFQIVKVPVPTDQGSRPNDEIENDPFFGPHLSNWSEMLSKKLHCVKQTQQFVYDCR